MPSLTQEEFLAGLVGDAPKTKKTPKRGQATKQGPPKAPTLEELQLNTQGRDIREVEDTEVVFPDVTSFKPQGLDLRTRKRIIDKGAKQMPGESPTSFLQRQKFETAARQLEEEGPAVQIPYAPRRPLGTKVREFVNRQGEVKKTSTSQAIAQAGGKLFTLSPEEFLQGVKEAHQAVTVPLLTGAENVLLPGLRYVDQTNRELGIDPYKPIAGQYETTAGVGTRLLEGVGSTIPFLAASQLGGTGLVSALGALSNAGQTFDEAKKKGVSDQEAFNASIPGLFIGALEGLGLGEGGIERTLGAGIRGGFVKEGGQELTTELLNNLNAKVLSGYDPQKALDEGLAEAFLLGGALGGAFGSIGGLSSGRYKEQLGDYLTKKGLITDGPARLSPGERTLFSGIPMPQGPMKNNDYAPWYYSALQQAVEKKFPPKMQPEQALAMLTDPQRGIKKEEFEYSGLADLIKDKQLRKEPITKQEILDTIRQNAVELEEVTLTEGSLDTDTQRARDLQAQLDVDLNNIYRDFAIETGREDLDDLMEFRPEEVPQNIRDRYNRTLEMDDEIRRLSRSRDEQPSTVQYGNFKALKGGKEGSYRELLLKLPSKQKLTEQQVQAKEIAKADPKTQGILTQRYGMTIAQAMHIAVNIPTDESLFKSSHFGGHNKGLLAHIRFDEGTDSEGKRVLRIQEIQSDWHQQGREKGYWNQKSASALIEEQGQIVQRMGELNQQDDPNGDEEFLRLSKRLNEINNQLLKGQRIPDAPFKNTWHELTLKRMLRYAAENGFDKLVWTTGKSQIDLYEHELRQNVESIDYISPEPGIVFVTATGRKGDVQGKFDIETGQGTMAERPGSLQDFVGPRVAEQILNGSKTLPQGEYGTIKGLDLSIGGQVHKLLYDEKLPQFARRLAKQFGGEYGRTQLGAYEEEKDPSAYYNPRFEENITIVRNGDLYQAVDSDGFLIETQNEGWATGSSEQEVQEKLDRDRTHFQDLKSIVNKPGQEAHYLTIPPSLKREVLDTGQKLFSGFPIIDALKGVRGMLKSSSKEGSKEENLQKFLQDSVVQEPVYHGTFSDFDEFKYSMDVGYHFGSPKAAQQRLRNGVDTFRSGARVGKYYLSLKNPLRIFYDPFTSILPTFENMLFRGDIKKTPEIKEVLEESSKKGAQYEDWAPKLKQLMVDQLKASGYDGIIYRNDTEDAGQDSYVIFDSNQAKSATGNKGTFDPSSSNISESLTMPGSDLGSLFQPQGSTEVMLPEQMEERAQGMGIEIAMTPSTVEKYQQESTNLKQQMLQADLSTPEGMETFEQLQQRWTKVANILMDSETFSQARSWEELQGMLQAKFIGEGGNFSLQTSPTRVLFSGYRLMLPTDFNKSPYLEVPKALFHALGRSESSGLHIPMVELGKVRVNIENNMPKVEVPEILAKVRDLAVESLRRGLTSIILVEPVPHYVLHESFHAGQQAAFRNNDPKILNSIKDLHDPIWAIEHPFVQKAMSTSWGRGISNGSTQLLVAELPAYIAGAQLTPDKGLPAAEAVEFMLDYLEHIAEYRGIEAIERLAQVSYMREGTEEMYNIVREGFLSGRNQRFDNRRETESRATGYPRSQQAGSSGPGVSQIEKQQFGQGRNKEVNASLSGEGDYSAIELQTLGSLNSPGRPTVISEARERSGLSREEFDETLKNLNRKGLVDLQRYTLPNPGPELLKVENDYYTVAVIREPEMQSSESDLLSADDVRKALNMSPGEPLTGAIAAGAIIEEGEGVYSLVPEPLKSSSKGATTSDPGGLGQPPPLESTLPEEDALYQDIVSTTFLRESVEDFKQLMREGGFEYNPRLPPGAQLYVAMIKNPGMSARVDQVLLKHGISMTQFVDEVYEAFSTSGRNLQLLSQTQAEWGRLFEGTSPEEIFRTKPAKAVINAAIKDFEAGRVGKDMDARMAGRLRKMALSQLGITATNVITTTGQLPVRMSSNYLASMMEALVKGRGSVAERLSQGHDYGMTQIQGGIEVLLAMKPSKLKEMWKNRDYVSQQTRDTLEMIKSYYPDAYAKLSGPKSAIEGSGQSKVYLDLMEASLARIKSPEERKILEQKVKKLQARYERDQKLAGRIAEKIDWAYELPLVPSTFQEFFFRGNYFVGELQAALAREGVDMSALGKLKGNKDLQRKVKPLINRAMDNALALTYAYNPKMGTKGEGRGWVAGKEAQVERAAAKIISAINDLGTFGFLIEGFPKAVFNGAKFWYEFGPLGLIQPMSRILTSEGRQSFDHQDFQRLAQGAIGIMLYGTAMALRHAVGGDEWWEIKTFRKRKDGTPIYLDIRRYQPFASFMWLTDRVERAATGRLGDIKLGAELAEQYLSMRRAGTEGIGLFTEFFDVVGKMISGAESDSKKIQLQQAIGRQVALPLNPLINLRDMYAEFSATERLRRDTREAGVWGPSLDRIPYLRTKVLPEATSLTQPAPVNISENPLLGQLGFRMVSGENFAAREWRRLGLQPTRFLQSDRDPKIDRAQKMAFQEAVGQFGSEFENDPNYQLMSDPDRAALWEDIILGPAGLAYEARLAGEEANPEEIEKRDKVKGIRPLEKRALEAQDPNVFK